MTRVVYVDDEPDLCRIFSLILARTGAEVRAFTDPEEALRYLAETPVDAIICDYRMPQMTGLELLGRLEGGIPFFMVSGDLAVTETLRSDTRVTGVLSKPFGPEQLLKAVSPYL